MKTQLDYKALDATRDERLRRIAEALTDCVMSARTESVNVNHDDSKGEANAG